MRIKKIVYLIIALILPGVIFVFLKMFGKNQFEVIPLYQTPSESINSNCQQIDYPYFVKDSVLNFYEWNSSNELTAFILISGSGEIKKEILNQAERLSEEIQSKSLVIVIIQDSNNELSKFTSSKMVNASIFNASKFCDFLLQVNQNAVLIDSERRIRGQYDLTDLDESDRMIVESKIILNKY